MEDKFDLESSSLSIVIVPSSCFSNPTINLSKVDLPQPLGPISTVVLPLPKLKEKSLSAKEELKDLEIFLSEIDTINITTSRTL